MNFLNIIFNQGFFRETIFVVVVVLVVVLVLVLGVTVCFCLFVCLFDSVQKPKIFLDNKKATKNYPDKIIKLFFVLFFDFCFVFFCLFFWGVLFCFCFLGGGVLFCFVFFRILYFPILWKFSTSPLKISNKISTDLISHSINNKCKYF